MKIIKKYIDPKKRIFAVRMNLDQNTDDVWNLYNLLNVGDLITGTCSRKIQKETSGLTRIEKKIIRCTLQIQQISYDTEADSLRIHGVNASENKWIGMGIQQSMNVTPPRQVSIFKKDYDSIHLQRLNQMIREQDAGHLIAITMEEGIAHIFLVSQNKTVLKAKIEKSIAKNSGAFNKNAQTKSKFFEMIVTQLHAHFTGDHSAAYTKVSCVVIGSPGFVCENFCKYMKELVAKQGTEFLKDFLSKTIQTHCSSGFQHSLKELMSSQVLNQRIKQMSCASETAILDKYFEMLALCEDKVTYGPKSVQCAVDQMAVETLLISDRLFRSKDIEKRKYYVKLHDQGVKDGLQVVVFSSMSPAGTRLNNMTGIAAILRFVLPQLDQMVEEDEGDLDSDVDSSEGKPCTTTDEDNASSDPNEERKSQSDRSSQISEAEKNYLDDVFQQLGGFDIGDYGDEITDEIMGDDIKPRK